jgi:predicted nucleic acid-binding Zn ribbon protein
MHPVMIVNTVPHVPMMQHPSPTNHIRKVMVGMSGSSMFDTDARTSGYGLSSSSTASKSKPILRDER